MKRTKKVILSILKKNKKLYFFLICMIKYNRSHNIFKTILFGFKSIFHFYIPTNINSKGMQIKKLLNKVDIKIPDKGFVYNIDIYKSIPKENRTIENTTIDYSKLLVNSLSYFKKENDKLKESKYKEEQLLVIQAIEEYIDRTIIKIQKSKRNDKEELIQIFKNMKDKSCSSTYDGLQRILFYNSILWQCGYSLNGIGRLDYILDYYYKKDLKNRKISEENLYNMIKEFFNLLHNNYWYKSNMLLGDTGQIIILGGLQNDKEYFSNQITYTVLNVLKDTKLPDPKVFLRVSNKMPKDLLKTALNCISTGVGSPLLSNDDVIIDKLKEFGTEKKDSYNYVTSACWEPLIVGKSVEQNNIETYNFLDPLEELLNEKSLNKYKKYEDFENKYLKYLEKSLDSFTSKINNYIWDEAPIHSMLVDGCNETLIDVSNGGGIYNNFGFTTVALGNTVNSLLNIKYFVYDIKKYTLKELCHLKNINYENNSIILDELKNNINRFGTDNEETISITNKIIEFTNNILLKTKTKFNTNFVFGLSSPSFITQSKNYPATLDGRKYEDPFLVHVSSDKNGLTFTELINFSSSINYQKNGINGNVVDYMFNPAFLNKNFDKIVDAIQASIEIGFYQMQLNVVSSDMLIDAKKNPNNYKYLVVRVWGFSAYFNDLPEKYKDLLIERALLNEGKSI